LNVKGGIYEFAINGFAAGSPAFGVVVYSTQGSGKIRKFRACT